MNEMTLVRPIFIDVESDNLIKAIREFLAAESKTKILTLLTESLYRQAISLFQPSVDYGFAMRNRNRCRSKCGEPITDIQHLHMADENTRSTIRNYVRNKLASQGFAGSNAQCPLESATDSLKLVKITLENELVKRFPSSARFRHEPEKWALFFEEAMATVIAAAMSDGISLNNGSNLTHEMNLGERIEGIIQSRKSGVYGDLIKPSRGYDFIVCVDYVYYGLVSNAEVDQPAYLITNLTNGSRVAVSDKYYLANVTYV